MDDKEDAFLQLVRDHQAWLRKICRVYADGPAAQNDLFQDLLVEVWDSLSSFEGDANRRTWLYRVVLNTALNHERRQTVRTEATLDAANPIWDDSFSAPDTDLQERDTLERLYAAIDRLDDVEKALVSMYLEGTSYAEMADVLGITESYVGVKLHRIRKTLADWLEDTPHGT